MNVLTLGFSSAILLGSLLGQQVEIDDIPLSRLLDNPDNFIGQTVRVQGTLDINAIAPCTQLFCSFDASANRGDRLECNTCGVTLRLVPTETDSFSRGIPLSDAGCSAQEILVSLGGEGYRTVYEFDNCQWNDRPLQLEKNYTVTGTIRDLQAHEFWGFNDYVLDGPSIVEATEEETPSAD